MRSSEWFAGDDEVAVAHRVALRSSGLDIQPNDPRPIIGIADSSSDLNPCNLPLRALAETVSAGVKAAGGIPVVFSVMSMGEDLMKPSALLYRNLLAMEVEEYIRSYPIDGVVLLANCDKSVPGALMGAISTDVPTLVLTGGARPIARFRGKRVGTGTDLWRAWEQHRTGEMSDEDWAEFEACLNCGQGACNTMGTASSMAITAETLGMCLPGSASIPADHPDRITVAQQTGERIVAMVHEDIRPSQVLTDAAFANAVRMLSACGGSTNAILHLLAIAGRTASDLSLDEIGRIAQTVPVLADVEPSGSLLIQDFHESGGVPAMVRELGARFDTSAVTAAGSSWADEAAQARPRGSAIRSISDPMFDRGAFAVVSGSLAPRGALIKVSAASPHLLRHTGPALVFHSYNDMRTRIDDEALPVSPETVLVFAGAGPVAVPGMPEWGMIPIPAKLAASGVRDMVRVTDARMSGTSFGTCVLHTAPEAAVGGPLALVRDGDLVTLDAYAGILHLDVSEDELSRRREQWQPPTSPHIRGWPMLYQRHVTQADLGCDLDFLRGDTPEARVFVPPVVGRS